MDIAMNEIDHKSIAAAEGLIRSLCHAKDDWQYDGVEQLTTDPWGADRLLVFRREDYVTCYVGFRGNAPLYVLQRIE